MLPAETETHTLPILCGITSETPTWITPVHNSCVALTIIVIVSRVRWEKNKRKNNEYFLYCQCSD